MPRVALLIEYLGKKFCGSQYQQNGRTVQSDLETALSAFLRQPIRLSLSGRTDSGVHARGQVAHFDVDKLPCDLWRLIWSLNGILADDIAVSNAQVVPDNFHARHSAIERQYVYCLLNRPQRSAILKETYYFMPYPLDLAPMIEAASFLLGNQDFSAFRSSSSDKGTSLCTVFQAELLHLGEGRLEFWIAANHFVYNMVRIIVGTLIEIGLSEKTPKDLKKALQQCDRSLAGETAPAWGLSLASVKYPESFQLFITQAINPELVGRQK
jgi:tRNA pseudouridine38-40 synthase